MKLRKFDIILVNFPFSDLTDSKIRPALIVNHLEGENAIVCQITTKKRAMSKYEIILNRKSCVGDIRFDSNIYVDMIFTLHKSLILDKIGYVRDEQIREQVNFKIKVLFNL